MELHKDGLVREMTKVFGTDARRMYHALRVTRYAEQLLEREGGQPEVVIAAAILHDIGIHEAERKYSSTAGVYQEKEGPPIARKILEKLKARETLIEEVCEIIANHHSPGRIDSLNFKIVYDADWLVNLGEEVDVSDSKKLSMLIDKIFLTETGNRLARQIYLEPMKADEVVGEKVEESRSKERSGTSR